MVRRWSMDPLRVQQINKSLSENFGAPSPIREEKEAPDKPAR